MRHATNTRVRGCTNDSPFESQTHLVLRFDLGHERLTLIPPARPRPTTIGISLICCVCRLLLQQPYVLCTLCASFGRAARWRWWVRACWPRAAFAFDLAGDSPSLDTAICLYLLGNLGKDAGEQAGGLCVHPGESEGEDRQAPPTYCAGANGQSN